MAGNYQGAGTATNTQDKTIVDVYQPAAAPASRLKIYDIVVGTKATPNDLSCEYNFTRSTSAPTGGGQITPTGLDPADQGNAIGLCHSAPTGEPTYTAGQIVLVIPKNLRSTVRWLPLDESRGLIIPKTTNNGIGGRANITGTTYAETISMTWNEGN